MHCSMIGELENKEFPMIVGGMKYDRAPSLSIQCEVILDRK